ncbi:hypothetical protein FZC84_08310 [Rossellomorea vietnamensis]|uniref:Uncharacterized protein n=1 Tax=Rossellomorea vietnamensis TaxID=218284 RepID=A0A5D4MER6_9BACI|nr:hypothetical protein [Rossellomorea vietnamensis]TYR99813.1 hypothetical protein FZC84_08310 [Rossellomorea vietnamensis]
MISKKQYIFIIILAISLGVLTAIWQISFWVTALMISLSVTLIVYAPFVWYMYFSKDAGKIGYYIEQRTKQPILQFYSSLANSDEEQASEALHLLKKKYKSPNMTAIFTVAYAAHQNRLSAVKEDILMIKDPSVRNYYEALLKIEEGDWSEAEEMSSTLTKPWMRESVKASLLHEKGMPGQAHAHEERAIELTNGMQRYLLVKKYNTLS